MLGWFRRGREAARMPSTPPPEEDSPDALLGQLQELVRYINRSSGRLPGEAVVTARRITDVLRDIIAGGAEALDGYAGVSVAATIRDYLPTTLQRFLALDPSQLHVPQAAGSTPVQSLQDQLDTLLDSVTELLAATWSQDADALLAQGNFLRTKFSRSDLDL